MVASKPVGSGLRGKFCGRDIHVARNAGCYAVGVDWGYHDPADFAAEGWEPDLLVSDPEQILALAPEA